MVSFDLTDILNNSNISVDLKTIQEFTYTLQKDIQTFMGNTSNLTVGLSPDEGVLISNLPEASFIRDFITNALVTETTTLNIHCSQVYRDHVFETLIATGYIPIGWIYQTSGNPKVAQCILEQLRNTWNLIVSDYLGHHTQRDLIYTKAKAFGLMVTETTMGKKKLLWYLVTTNQQDCDVVQLWMQDNKINNLVVYNENDYDRVVVASTNRFLIHFDRIMDPFTGIVFKVKLDIKSSVPTYLAMIGCDKMCVIEPGADRSDYQLITSQYVAKEYKRAQVIETTVRVPFGYIVDFVSLNGTPYFIDTYAMAAAGIEVVLMDETTLTGYQTYKVTVSGQSQSVQIYIDACQDFTKIGFARQVISTAKSTITIGDTGVAFNIVFNFPFIFFNTDKVHVFARKDDESREEEVLIKQVIVGDKTYAERCVTFGSVSSSGTYPIVDAENSAIQRPPISCGYPYPHIHHKLPHGYRENPDVIHCLPPYTQTVGNGVPGVMDTTPEARVMIFGVSESGSIFVTFDGYTDYKYFRVEFEDYAMIAYVANNEIIPVIETFKVINPKLVVDCDPENPGESGSGCGCGCEDCTKPTDPDNTGEGDGDNTGTDTEGGTTGGTTEGGEINPPDESGADDTDNKGNTESGDSIEGTEGYPSKDTETKPGGVSEGEVIPEWD